MRRQKRKRLSCLLKDLKETTFIELLKLNNNFSGITLDMIKNQIYSQYPRIKDPKGHRYSDEIKKFVLTLNFYVPREYKYMRNVFSLSHSCTEEDAAKDIHYRIKTCKLHYVWGASIKSTFFFVAGVDKEPPSKRTPIKWF